MDLSQKLKSQGWHLTNDGLSKLPADIDKSDTRKVVHWLLNTDLRDIGAGALPTEISRKDDSIPGCIVLQITKIRNISAPKSNEESKTAPRFLHMELTDGVTQIFALEYEHISNISLNTPPGTKLYLRSDKVPLIQGILALRPSDVQVLGGEVTALVEKWELTRTLQKYARGGRVNTGSSGPPPWIPFGQKIQQFNDDKNFKSLGTGNGAEKEKDPKENEFDAMRNEAIAEAAKSGARKVFGGGNQQMLDHNVKKIIEKGFSEVEAKTALRGTRNNLERALYNLKRRDEGGERSENKEIVRGPPRREAFKGSKKASAKEELNVVSTKPAGNVSLFDFLNDKLPANTESSVHATTTTVSTTSSNTRNERPSSKYESSSKFNNGSSGNQQYQQTASGSRSQNNTVPNNQTANGPSSSQQQQSSRSSKFENNISSSFAIRNTPGSYPGDGGGDGGNNYRNRNRNERGERGGRGGRGGSMSSYGSRQAPDYGRNGANSNHVANSNYNNANRNQIRSSQERDRGGSSNYHHASNHMESREPRSDGNRSSGNDNRSYKMPPSSSRYSNKPSYTNNSAASNTNSNRKYSDNREASHAESDQMKELVEDTTKMKIDSRPSNRGGGSGRGSRNHPNQSHYQKQHQQPAASQPSVVQVVVSQPAMQHGSQQQAHTVYNPLPNGFAYDHNKIIGFQNKESNEYALNVLKGQSLPATVATISQPPPNAHPQYSQPPPPMHVAPQQSFHAGPPQFILRAPQPVPAYGIPTIDGGSFNWKVGDHCLAKYWDDGRYYEAEITGLSDKTCVVLFMGYGNYEEVLKSDCLPVTSTNPTLVAASPHQLSLPPQVMQQQSMHAIHSHSNPQRSSAPGQSSSSGRYRGERQMYVPPPKREA